VKEYADKALQLDNTVAEGHIARANLKMYYEWDLEEGYKSLQEAIRLNPTAVDAYDMLGFYYIMKGDKQKALETLQEAEKIDPLSPVVLQSLGNMYIFNSQYDKAIEVADKILALHPRMRASIELKGWATGMGGDWEKALTLFEEVHRLTNHPLKGLMGMGFTYGKLGYKEKAMEVIRRMEQRQAEEPGAVIDADLAAVWYGLGDSDKSFYYLNQCVDKRMGPILFFLEFPAFEGVKNDPRYPPLRKRLEQLS